jgi:hypothetical protein
MLAMKKFKKESQYDGGKIKENNLRTKRSRSYLPKVQQNISRSKMDSVKAEMQIRSKENSVDGKTGNRNGDRKNKERAGNS